MKKKFDVATLCNALVDVVVEATEDELKMFSLKKGCMHLVDAQAQRELLAHFKDKPQTIEVGGSSLNTIRGLAMLGKKTSFTGMIGDDAFGAYIKKRLEELQILYHLSVHPEESTGSCLVLVTPDGERTMNTHLGASCLYGIEDISVADIIDAKIFHFCGYQWFTPNQKEAISRLLEESKRHHTFVSFDLADPFVVKENQQDFLNFIKNNADLVFANREESFVLYGLPPTETVREMAKYGAISVIKLGAEGALIHHKDEVYHIPPHATQVVDTTAAGDMFASGFLYGFLSEKSLGECGNYAALLASDVISRYGATLSKEVIKKVLKA